MSKSAIIYDVVRTAEPEKSDGFMDAVLKVTFGDIFREHMFQIVLPNGQENIVVYAKVPCTRETRWDDSPSYIKLDRKQYHERDIALQRVVNNLESEGYHCESRHLALLMSCKTDKLILTWRGK